MTRLKVLLVANVLTHYRLPLYEALQELVDLQIVFYSDGGEWYWGRSEQPSGETLHNAKWLKGFWLGRTRFAPGLIPAVMFADADVVIKDPNGKFALPATYGVARLRRRPFVFWASMWEHPRAGVHRFTRPIMRFVYRHSDRIVTYGRHVSRFVIQEGADPNRVTESPQAVTPVHAPAPNQARWSTPLRLLYVGRLEPWKGVDVLLRALGTLADLPWTLTIAGDGSDRLELDALAVRLGISERVHFMGKVPNEELACLYEEAAAVVVPSVRTHQVTEVWSLVVNEAMQAGALVVATDAVGAAADGLVEDRTTGFVCRQNDPESLATTLRMLHQEDPAVLVSAAAAGQERVMSYTHQRAAQAFADAASAALAQRWRRT